MSSNNLFIKTPQVVKEVGYKHPVFIVAEMSANHGQDLNCALKIIDKAAEAGADAIKLQTYTPDTITLDCDNKWFQIKTGKWSGQTFYQLYQKAYMPWQWHKKLKEYGESRGLVVFSFPLDITAVDFLEKQNFPLYKIGSPEIIDTGLLKKVAETKKPVILSIGMASLDDIELAIKVLKENGAPSIALLYCVSAYPAKPTDLNLTTLGDMAEKFGLTVGLSDHTISVAVAIAAVALGAKIIEKHLTLSRSDGGVDAEFSLEPNEFKEMVEAIRETESALGRPYYGASEAQEPSQVCRRSLFVVKDIKKGEQFTKENVRSIRPGYGMPPRFFSEILGTKASQDIKRGTPLLQSIITNKIHI